MTCDMLRCDSVIQLLVIGPEKLVAQDVFRLLAQEQEKLLRRADEEQRLRNEVEELK